MPSDETVRAHAWISGRVQGVFFRHSTRQQAERRGVSGWVRNLSDGRVEAVFEGPQAAVEQVLRWCHDGPSAARVDDVEVSRGEPPEALDGFRTRASR